MTFAVARGMGSRFGLPRGADPSVFRGASPVVARSSARHLPEAEPFRLNRTFR
jgi:hypothetical protein